MIIEALGPDEAEDPLVYIKAEDYPEDQVVIVFAREIKPLIVALTEAAVWLADEAAAMWLANEAASK